MLRGLITFVFIFTVSLIFPGCGTDNSAIITGTVSNHAGDEYIYLDELKSDVLDPVDSVRLSDDGSFTFTTNVKRPSFYLLKLNDNNFLTLLVEPEQEIFIRAHRDSLNYPLAVEGSEGTMLMAEYNRELRKTINNLLELHRIFEENQDKDGLPELMESLDSLAQEELSKLNRYTKDYIDSNINSLVSLVALYQQVAPGVPVLDQAKDWRYFVKVDSSLYRQYPDYEPVLTLHRQVEELVASLRHNPGITGTSSGAMAPEISLPSPGGDTINLSSTRGSIVLLDFWAAWCAPCRKENPNLVKAFDAYHKKGFQIYQVSLDKTKEAWVKGIEDDKLGRWIHVSDIKYWNSIVVSLYDVKSIPANYLLDRDGRIIATNLRGEQLIKKLAEVFSNK
jgi:peroxiredoxin